jgi:hypothetical protein
LENLSAYRDEVPALGIVEAGVKCNDKVTSAELCERSFLIKDRVPGNIYASFSDFVDGFDNIQVNRGLLPREINGRIYSRTQGAQELVIIKVRGAVGRLSTDGADGSLKKRGVSWEA